MIGCWMRKLLGEAQTDACALSGEQKDAFPPDHTCPRCQLTLLDVGANAKMTPEQ